MQHAAAIRARLGLFSIQDRVLIGYSAVVATLLWLRSPPPGPGPIIHQVYACLFLVPAAALLARKGTRLPLWLRLNFYRVVIIASLPWSYLMLRDILPVIRTDSVDAVLAGLDQRIFGLQPVLWAERWNHRSLIEWMSFFYFNYYTLILGVTVGAVWIAHKKPVIAVQFGIGMALLYCVGHLVYMLVPAYGPYKFLADRFHGPIDGARFWGMVWGSVTARCADKDAFPSIHTAASTFCAFFAAYQATLDRRWRIPAIVTGFVAANIVLSTIVLRWHYAIDVLAGLALSTTVTFVSARLASWEEARRAALGLPAVFPTE